jgi:hypothetical protein
LTVENPPIRDGTETIARLGHGKRVVQPFSGILVTVRRLVMDTGARRGPLARCDTNSNGEERSMRNTLFLLLACAMAGCDETKPPQDSKPTEDVPPRATATSPQEPPAKSLPAGPSVIYRSEESSMLEKLMGSSNRVYEFKGTYLECWLEYETSDGESQRSDPVRLNASKIRPNVEPNFDILKHMQGWIVIRGHQYTRLELHLIAQISWETERGTTHTTVPRTLVSHLDLPKRQTSSKKWQGDFYNPPSLSVVKLPEQVGE